MKVKYFNYTVHNGWNHLSYVYGLIVYLGRFRSRKLWSWFIVGMNAFLIILYFTILLFCQIVMISVNIKSRGVRQTDSFILSQSIIKYKSFSLGPSRCHQNLWSSERKTRPDFRKVFQYHTFSQMSSENRRLTRFCSTAAQSSTRDWNHGLSCTIFTLRFLS